MARRKKSVESVVSPLPDGPESAERDRLLESEIGDQPMLADTSVQAEAELGDDREFLKAMTESLIFSSREPLTEAQYVAVVGKRGRGELESFVKQLNLEYAQTGRSFEILAVAGGFQFFTKPDYSGVLKKLAIERGRTRVSRAALETLAVVAFRGPVTRLEIDEIRGVDSGGVLRTLLDRRLVAVKGRANVVGKPLLYETTDEFLKHFGLSSLADLPRDSELTREWGRLQDQEQIDSLPVSSDDTATETWTENLRPIDELNSEEPKAVKTNGHPHGRAILEADVTPDEGENSP